jgi:hypothetical protein
MRWCVRRADEGRHAARWSSFSAGQPDVHVDLYGMIASGNFNADVVLLSGDRVFVGPLGPRRGAGPVGAGI